MKTKKIIFSILMVFVMIAPVLFAGCKEEDPYIKINTPFKTTYVLGEELDVTGGIINYTENGKTTLVAVSDVVITNFSTSTVGNRSMILTYNGCTLSVSYVVNPVNVQVGDVFKGHSSYYEYVYFKSVNEIVWAHNNDDLGGKNAIISDLSNENVGVTWPTTKEIVDNKYVINSVLSTYNSYSEEVENMNLKIVINASNYITLEIWITKADGTLKDHLVEQCSLSKMS